MIPCSSHFFLCQIVKTFAETRISFDNVAFDALCGVQKRLYLFAGHGLALYKRFRKPQKVI